MGSIRRARISERMPPGVYMRWSSPVVIGCHVSARRLDSGNAGVDVGSRSVAVKVGCCGKGMLAGGLDAPTCANPSFSSVLFKLHPDNNKSRLSKRTISYKGSIFHKLFVVGWQGPSTSV